MENTAQNPIEPTGSATYCPEDNKLRLYVGRVPREEYLKLRAEGWTALHKQRETGGGDFAAVWTPERRDTALAYSGGYIGDEDQGPAERAADRAERFSGYRDKREGEAIGHADRYDSGPQAHGYQSAARAERAAARHDRIADRAGDQWSKAEYWQQRTAGVISHALHKAAPGVRMGRIKTIEAELRREEKAREEVRQRFELWRKISAMTDADAQNKAALQFAGGYGDPYGHDYEHPRQPGKKGSLWDLLHADRYNGDGITGAEAAALYMGCRTDPKTPEWEQTRLSAWVNHHKMRLAYENQMIEAEGGRAAFVDMEAGGWIGERQIRKVNKSNVTGRVVSVEVMGLRRGFSKGSGYTREETVARPVLINVERLPADSYKAPTDADKIALADTLKAEKAAAPQKESCPLINPTEGDALKLQAMLNANEISRYATPQTPVQMTFAQYTGRGTVTTICEDGTEHRTRYGSNLTRCDVFKVRTIYGDNYSARRVVILSDKPKKGIPWDAVAKAKAKQPSAEKMLPHMGDIAALIIGLQGYRQRTDSEQKLLEDAAYVGWVSVDCSTPQWTDAGAKARQQFQEVHA